MMLQVKNCKSISLLLLLLFGATGTLRADVLHGVFSVGPNSRIQFASGNLQYNYSTSSYQVAANQWDVIGDGNKTAKEGNTGVRDLFQWSELNAMSAAGYRVLTKAEWEYLFMDRTNAYELFALAIVNGVKGVVILPDYETWTQPAGVPAFNYYYVHESFEKNQYDADQWALMEAAGAAFFPATGYMYGSGTYTVADFERHGSYWSATEFENPLELEDQKPYSEAFRVQFDDGGGAYFSEIQHYGKERFYAVRYVKTAAAPDDRVVLSEYDEQPTFEAKKALLEGGSEAWVYRTLRKVGSLNTLTLPFDVDDIAASPLGGDGVEVYTFNNASVENKTLVLDITQVTDNRLVAGTPYLIQWANTGEVMTLIHFTGITRWDTDNSADNAPVDATSADVLYHGFYGREKIYDAIEGEDITTWQHLILFLQGENKLYWPKTDDPTKMLGFRAYFEIKASAVGGAPVRHNMPAVLRIVSTPTGVENANPESGTIHQKFIRDGHFVILRNGVEYNANGQIINAK